jgi:hypothetical protein
MNTAVVAAGTMCGSVACKTDNALHVGIVQDPNYSVTDPAKPLKTTVSFGQGDPCRGLGGTCLSLYWRHDASDTPKLATKCLVSGHATPAPCLNRTYKVNGDIYYEMLGLSTDPDYLAPVRAVTSGK